MNQSSKLSEGRVALVSILLFAGTTLGWIVLTIAGVFEQFPVMPNAVASTFVTLNFGCSLGWIVMLFSISAWGREFAKVAFGWGFLIAIVLLYVMVICLPARSSFGA